MNSTIDLFFCYSHEDKALRDELEKHLAVLKRNGVIRGWHDRRIVPGENWKNAIDEHLQAAHVIVPLISADFLASDYCDVEMKRALERREQGTARVVPILLRGCDWKDSPLGCLQALPTSEKPVKNWRNRDKAWADVVRGLREVFGQISTAAPALPPVVLEHRSG